MRCGTNDATKENITIFHFSHPTFHFMPLNKEVFKTRTLSAILFAAIMLAGLLTGRISFLLLFSIIHFGCWHEYIKLIEKIYQTTIHRYTRWGFMLMGFGLMLAFAGAGYTAGGYSIAHSLSFPFSLAGFVLLLMGVFQKNQIIRIQALAAAALGWVYISLSWGLMLDIRNEGFGQFLGDIEGLLVVLIFIASIWINDTMAYIVGSLIGKTPFSPVSPKKTWEGTAGGALLAIVVVTVVGHFSALRLEIVPLAAIAAIAAVVGTLGDLLESKLKRSAGVKDSGAMLPGHGGFLDRFDSMLLATPFVWLLVKLAF